MKEKRERTTRRNEPFDRIADLRDVVPVSSKRLERSDGEGSTAEKAKAKEEHGQSFVRGKMSHVASSLVPLTNQQQLHIQ